MYVYICIFMYVCSVEQAKEWVSTLKPSGGCNLLRALKHLHTVRDVETVVLVLGSV